MAFINAWAPAAAPYSHAHRAGSVWQWVSPINNPEVSQNRRSPGRRLSTFENELQYGVDIPYVERRGRGLLRG